MAKRGGIGDGGRGGRLGAPADVRGSRTQVLRQPYLVPTEKRRACLTVLRGEEVGRTWTLSQPELVLGRDPGLQASITDDMVSRRHAVVRRVGTEDERRHVLRDLGSTNGTLVDNRKVAEMELRDGDRIILGETVLLYRLLDDLDVDYHGEIQRLIRYHDLTGFLMLKAFYRVVRRGIAAAGDDGAFALVMVDVDNLKEINTLYGHRAGSAVIQRIGEIFRERLAEGQEVGIYGGDEFVCYLPGLTLAEGHRVAEELRAAVAEDGLEHDGVALPFSICLGVAQFPVHGKSIAQLLQAADEALHRAKTLGRNRTVAYEL